MNVCTAWPRIMSRDVAEAYAGGEKIFAALVTYKDGITLLKPIVQGKNLTRYDRVSIDAALDAWKGFDE